MLSPGPAPGWWAWRGARGSDGPGVQGLKQTSDAERSLSLGRAPRLGLLLLLACLLFLTTFPGMLSVLQSPSAGSLPGGALTCRPAVDHGMGLG